MADAAHRRHKRREYIDYSLELLRRDGGRITKPRRAVLECLADSDRSLSPNAVMEKIKNGREPIDVDLATVYRNLEALQAHGLVHRVGPNADFVACAHATCEVDLHLIVHCSKCGLTQELDIPEELLSPMKKYVHRRTGYQFDEHFMQMSGACKSCLKEKQSEAPAR
jgi:Fur family ferric uptake transcriptional regulator